LIFKNPNKSPSARSAQSNYAKTDRHNTPTPNSQHINPITWGNDYHPSQDKVIIYKKTVTPCNKSYAPKILPDMKYVMSPRHAPGTKKSLLSMSVSVAKEDKQEFMRPMSSFNTPINANNKFNVPERTHKCTNLFQAKISTVGNKSTFPQADRFHSRDFPES